MKTEEQTFSISGPPALKDNYSWQSADHRRCIASCLVRGVTVLEYDRKRNRQGSAALALPWWESFNFELLQILQDHKDNSYFAAIYRSKSWSHDDKYRPKHVIAFRGTMLKKLRDMKMDILVTFSEIHVSSRFDMAVAAVNNIIAEATSAGQVEPANSVWLCGHSLGASLALAVGKDMVIKKNYYLETFLFNLPFSGLPLELIKSKKARNAIRFTRWTANFVASAVVNYIDPILEPDQRLSAYTPNIFVNSKDIICTEYIGYFRNKKTIIETLGSRYITNLSTGHTLISLGSLVAGRKPEPSFQLFSARLIICQTGSSGCFLAFKPHQLDQWWTTDLDCYTELY